MGISRTRSHISIYPIKNIYGPLGDKFSRQTPPGASLTALAPVPAAKPIRSQSTGDTSHWSYSWSAAHLCASELGRHTRNFSICTHKCQIQRNTYDTAHPSACRPT